MKNKKKIIKLEEGYSYLISQLILSHTIELIRERRKLETKRIFLFRIKQLNQINATIYRLTEKIKYLDDLRNNISSNYKGGIYLKIK